MSEGRDVRGSIAPDAPLDSGEQAGIGDAPVEQGDAMASSECLDDHGAAEEARAPEHQNVRRTVVDGEPRRRRCSASTEHDVRPLE